MGASGGYVPETDSAILLINCDDQMGIVSRITGFLFEHGANILHTDHHQDNTRRLFFMRIEWDLARFILDEKELQNKLTELTADFCDVEFHLAFSARRPVVAIFASHHHHCVQDLLHRHKLGILRCDIPVIIGNDVHLEKLAKFYEKEFQFVGVDPDNEQRSEKHYLELLEKYAVDSIVLARYSATLSSDFITRYRNRVIAVYQSFWPPVNGGPNAHLEAYGRGVKLIGATSHYVTDQPGGTIIEQDTVRVSHRDRAEDLEQKGADLERDVLSRAVRWFLDHRVLDYKGKTVVFD